MNKLFHALTAVTLLVPIPVETTSYPLTCPQTLRSCSCLVVTFLNLSRRMCKVGLVRNLVVGVLEG